MSDCGQSNKMCMCSICQIGKWEIYILVLPNKQYNTEVFFLFPHF